MPKIPFKKEIADNVLLSCDFFIQMCEIWTKENNRKDAYLTIDELKHIRTHFKNLYFNDKVELLEIDE